LEHATEKQGIIFEAAEEEISRWMNIKGKHNPLYPITENPLYIQINFNDEDKHSFLSRNGKLLREPMYSQDIKLDITTRVGNYEESTATYIADTKVPSELCKKDLKKIIFKHLDDGIRLAFSTHGANISEKFTIDKEHLFLGPWQELKPAVYYDIPKKGNIDLERYKDIIRYLTSELKKRNKNIEDTDASLSIYRNDIYIADSEKTKIYLSQLSYKLRLVSEIITKEGYKEEASGYLSGHSIEEIYDKNNLEKFIEEVNEESDYIKKAVVENSGSNVVLLGQESFGTLIHETFAHLLSAEYIDSNSSSVFADSLNKKVVPVAMTVWNDPTAGLDNPKNPLSWGSYKYDLEGVKARKTLLIDKGVLVNYLHSRSTAAKRKIMPPGNVRGELTIRGNEANPPEPRISNLIIEIDKEKSVNFDELKEMAIEEAERQGKDYALFCDAIGGNVSIDSGIMVLKPTKNYRIFYGKEERVIIDELIIGNPHNILTEENILGYGNDYKVSKGVCGASSGFIPVTERCPCALIRSLSVNRNPERMREMPPLLKYKE